MKFMKKWTKVLVITILTAMTLQPIAYADDIKGHPQEAEMRALIDKNIMHGYGDNTFKPGEKVTRAQFAAFVARALDLPEGENIFPDVPVGYKGNLDFEIGRASSAKIIQGYTNGSFKPDEYITREQMATILQRALTYKNVEDTNVQGLAFLDMVDISPWAEKAIQFSVSLGIINGHTDLTFKPKNDAIRAHAAKVIFKMLDVVEANSVVEEPVEPTEPEEPTDPIEPTQPTEPVEPTEPTEPVEEPVEPLPPYQVVSINDTSLKTVIANYLSYEDAFNNVQSNQFIALDDKIIWMDQLDGGTATAVGTPSTLLYRDETLRSDITYIQTGSQMEVLEVKKDTVKVRISGAEGYARLSDVLLNPSITNPGRSYYRVNQFGQLYHHIFLNNKMQSAYSIGPAPLFMEPEKPYFSWNGFQFEENLAFQYFQYLPFYTKSSYTAEQLNNYVRVHRPLSPLKDLGSAFKQVEQEMNVNALHLLALAIHEGGWGESAIALNKKNLYGIGAYDSSAYESAVRYETYEDSIRDAATKLLNNYSNHTRWMYNGPQLGNKAIGANVRYASDPYWGQKAAGHMYRIDHYLGEVDSNPDNRYKIGLKNIEGTINVRNNPGTNGTTVLYQLKKGLVGQSMLIVEEMLDHNGDTWYKIVSDHPNHDYVWVYGEGSLGHFVKVMPNNQEPTKTVTEEDTAL